jgi:hypothetical protein
VLSIEDLKSALDEEAIIFHAYCVKGLCFLFLGFKISSEMGLYREDANMKGVIRWRGGLLEFLLAK